MININIAIVYFTILFSNFCIAQSDTLQYKQVVFEKDSSLSEDNSNKLYLNISYPIFRNYESINNHIKSFALSKIFESDITLPEKEIWIKFVNEYKSIENPSALDAIGWEVQRKVSVIYNESNLLSLKFMVYEFLGGAHGNSSVAYSTYDLSSSEMILLSDIFVADFENTLNMIAEKEFRHIRNIDKDKSFEKSGFWFNDNVFSVNDNFAVTKNGILFYFNNYEITSYANGPTKIVLPFNSLKQIIKPGGFLEGL